MGSKGSPTGEVIAWFRRNLVLRLRQIQVMITEQGGSGHEYQSELAGGKPEALLTMTREQMLADAGEIAGEFALDYERMAQ